MPVIGKSRIGFIGYGEAGSSIANGLAGNRGAQIYAFDRTFLDEEVGPARRKRAAASSINVVSSAEELALNSDIIISTVVASGAVEVAKMTGPWLTNEHIFVDLNSVSPRTKSLIAVSAEQSGAKFVEGAIMTNVSKKGHRVPIFACGPGTRAFIETVGPMGMSIEDLGEKLGRASATKMFRSIIVKGLEALFLECLLAASEFDVGDEVLRMVEEGYPGISRALADQLTARTAEHGIRRADEMKEVAETLLEMNIEPYMAAAAAQRIASCGAGLKERFLGNAPRDYHEVINAIRAISLR